MSTKPDEISQAAWDEGMKEARFYADWLHAGNSSGSVSPHAVTALADTIARAIMAAEKRGEEREREAISGIGDVLVDLFDGHAMRCAEEVEVVEARSAESAVRNFVDEIRKRGEG